MNQNIQYAPGKYYDTVSGNIKTIDDTLVFQHEVMFDSIPIGTHPDVVGLDAFGRAHRQPAGGGGGGGDVNSSSITSVDNAIARFDGVTGKTIQNSTGATVTDTGRIDCTGVISTGTVSSQFVSVQGVGALSSNGNNFFFNSTTNFQNAAIDFTNSVLTGFPAQYNQSLNTGDNVGFQSVTTGSIDIFQAGINELSSFIGSLIEVKDNVRFEKDISVLPVSNVNFDGAASIDLTNSSVDFTNSVVTGLTGLYDQSLNTTDTVEFVEVNVSDTNKISPYSYNFVDSVTGRVAHNIGTVDILTGDICLNVWGGATDINGSILANNTTVYALIFDTEAPINGMRYIRKLDAVPGTSYDVFSNLGFFETVWEADSVGMTNNLKQVFTDSVALTGLSLTGIGERVVITDAVTGELKYRMAAAIAPPVSLVDGGFAGGETLVQDGVGPNLATKGLVAGTGILLTSDLNDVTISTTSNITVNTISSALVDIFMVDTVKFLGDTQFTGLSDFTDNTLVDMTSAGTLTLDLTGSNVVGLPSAGVVGPVVSTLNSIPTYNNITGDLIKNNSTCLIDGVGNVQCPTIDCVSGDILDLECTNIICNLDLNTEDLTTQTILCGGSLTLDASTSTYAGAIVNFAGATIQNFPLSFGDVSFVGVAPTLGQLAYYDDNSGQNINNSAILVNGSNDLTNINVLGASNIISTTCQSNSVTTNVISPIAPGVNILYAGNLHNFLDSIQVTNNITCATIEVTTSLTLDGTLISVDSDPTNDNDTFLTVGPLGELQQTIIEPVYGGLFTTNNGTLTTIISVNTFTLLGSIYTNLATSAGISFPTQAITISSTQSGVCTVGGSVSIESQSASFIQYELAIFKNGVELEGSRRLTSTTDSSEDKNIHTSTTTSYVLNDVFDYRIRNITGTTDILITNCTLIINKL